VNGHGDIEPVGFLDGSDDLLAGEFRHPGILPHGLPVHATGCTDFDHARTLVALLSNAGAYGVDSVAFHPPERIVTAADNDRLAARVDPRPRDVSTTGGVGDADGDVVCASDISDGRHAAFDLFAGHRDGVDRLFLFGLSPEGFDRIASTVPHEVDVEVDQSGREKFDLFDGLSRSGLVVVHSFDGVVFDSDPLFLLSSTLCVPYISV
jgi:hypothetical protein